MSFLGHFAVLQNGAQVAARDLAPKYTHFPARARIIPVGAGTAYDRGEDTKGPRKFADASGFSEFGSRSTLELDILELENIHLSVSIMLEVVDWTKLTTLTILRCETSDELWEALQQHFAPLMVLSTADSTHHYPLKLSSIRVDTVTDPSCHLSTVRLHQTLWRVYPYMSGIRQTCKSTISSGGSLAGTSGL